MKKVLASIGAFIGHEAVDLEKDFVKVGQAIGAFLKKEQTDLKPIIQVLASELQALEAQAVTAITTAALTAGRQLLYALIAAL